MFKGIYLFTFENPRRWSCRSSCTNSPRNIGKNILKPSRRNSRKSGKSSTECVLAQTSNFHLKRNLYERSSEWIPGKNLGHILVQIHAVAFKRILVSGRTVGQIFREISWVFNEKNKNSRRHPWRYRQRNYQRTIHENYRNNYQGNCIYWKKI